MPTNDLLYNHATDQVADNVVPIVQTGTAATGYGPSCLVDGNPAKPAKLQETSGAWAWDFTNPQRVDIAAVPHHNLTAGLEVRIQGNATNSWGSPTLNGLFTVPAQDDDLFRPGFWLDLTGLSGYTAVGFRWWRLAVIGVNAAPVQIGEAWLGSVIRTLSPNIQWGATDGEDHPLVEHKTDFGVSTIFDLGTRQRALSGQVDTTDVNRDLLRQWHRANKGRAGASLIVPDGTLNDALMVRFKNTTWQAQLNLTDRNLINLDFEEVSRGLYL